MCSFPGSDIDPLVLLTMELFALSALVVSDQYPVSPCYVNTMSNIHVMRI